MKAQPLRSANFPTKKRSLLRTMPGIPFFRLCQASSSSANPAMLNNSGNRAYCSNHEGTIFYTQQELIAGGVVALQQDGTIPSGVFPIK